MLRPVLAAALLLSAPAAVAQAVTRPVVTVSAGVMRTVSEILSSSPGEGSAGYLGQTFYAASVGGEVPVNDLDGLMTASAGGSVRAASSVFGGDFAPQSVALYGRLGTPVASVLLGVSVDVGSGFFGSDNTSGINSDGQTAVIAQVRVLGEPGHRRVFGQVDGAFALPSTDEIRVNTINDLEGRPYPIRVRSGHQGSLQIGAAVPAGPVEVALALTVAARSEGSYRFTGDLPPPIEAGGGAIPFPRDTSFRLGYTRTVGLIPSVTYLTPDERVTLRIDGSFTGYSNMENTPLGATLSSKDGPEVRPAVTVSVSVGL